MTNLSPQEIEAINADAARIAANENADNIRDLRKAIQGIGDVTAYTAPEGKEGYGVLVKLDKGSAENLLVHDGLLSAFAGHHVGYAPVELVDYDYGENGLRLRLKPLEGNMTHEQMVQHVRGVRETLKDNDDHNLALNAVIEQGRNILVTEGNHDVDPVHAYMGDGFVLAGFKADEGKGKFR